jgi:hypothetical protein
VEEEEGVVMISLSSLSLLFLAGERKKRNVSSPAFFYRYEH